MTAATTALTCRRELRRQLVRNHEKLNGIDYVDVNKTDDGVFLCVHFFNGLPDVGELTKANVVIRGGRRVTGVHAVDFDTHVAEDEFEESCLSIELSEEGDFSTYTLCFVEAKNGRPTSEPMQGLDPRYACIDFRFKMDCPALLDCRPADACEPPERREPQISYLAKDYASFRQLILDRLAVVMPDWRERHVPDLGITIVELLAYAGDYLSYYQDAVATEAYLDTARLRTSVRRHARLVDYAMHEGCNARTFVHLQARSDAEIDPRSLYFTTTWSGATGIIALHADLVPHLARVTVFEPLVEKPIRVKVAHNAIRIYTWGNSECCLPKGATRATLCDHFVEEPKPEPPKQYAPKQYAYVEQEPPPKKKPRGKKHGYEPPPPPPPEECPEPAEPPPPRRALSLEAGDFLLFEELACATTAPPDPQRDDPNDCTPLRTEPLPDADRTHRQVVRLTRVTPGVDVLTGQPIVEVEWAIEDALAFPLCISAIGRPPECELVNDLAIARGNIVLTDHGLTIVEPLPPVRELPEPPVCEDVDTLAYVTRTPDRYRPHLSSAPLTFAQPLVPLASASELLVQDPRAAVPQIRLAGIAASYARPFPMFDAADLNDVTAIAERFEHSLNEDLIEQARRLSASLRVRLLEHDRAVMIPRDLHEALATELPEEAGRSEAEMHNLAMALADAIDPSLTTLLHRLSPALRDRFDKGEAPLTDDEKNLLESDLRRLLEPWTVRRDLLASDGDAADFVVETDDDGRAHLRFGNGELGRAVEAGMAFLATWRAGNGTRGLIGRESLRHVVYRESKGDALLSVRNPLPASGAIDPEPVSDVKMFAPHAFRSDLHRAVIASDYAAIAALLGYPRRHPRIQGTAATLAWNGSWYEAAVAVDRAGSAAGDTELLGGVEGRLQRVRRMGHDLRVSDARPVPILLALEVCILPEYVAAHVLAELMDVLSSRLLRDGRRGFFHPDNLTFGEAIHVSRIVAAAQAVAGVADAGVPTLRRLFAADNPDFTDGLLRLGPLEVAQLDNDPVRPENGLLEIHPRGGR